MGRPVAELARMWQVSLAPRAALPYPGCAVLGHVGARPVGSSAPILSVSNRRRSHPGRGLPRRLFAGGLSVGPGGCLRAAAGCRAHAALQNWTCGHERDGRRAWEICTSQEAPEAE